MAKSAEKSRLAQASAHVEHFNHSAPPGTPVLYWPGVKEGPGVTGKSRSAAQLLGGHTAVVWVEGRSDCIALSHVEIAPRVPR